MTPATPQVASASARQLAQLAVLVLSMLAYGSMPNGAFAEDNRNVQEQEETAGAAASRETRTRSEAAGVSRCSQVASPPRAKATRITRSADGADSIVSRPVVGSSLPLRL